MTFLLSVHICVLMQNTFPIPIFLVVYPPSNYLIMFQIMIRFFRTFEITRQNCASNRGIKSNSWIYAWTYTSPELHKSKNLSKNFLHTIFWYLKEKFMSGAGAFIKSIYVLKVLQTFLFVCNILAFVDWWVK